jgi:hypothetical protein
VVHGFLVENHHVIAAKRLLTLNEMILALEEGRE